MLRDIQSYISSHGIVSVQDLSLHFHADNHTLQPMLTKLSRKGRIRKLPVPTRCEGCTCCHHTSLELYQWVDAVTGNSREPERLTPCEQRLHSGADGRLPTA